MALCCNRHFSVEKSVVILIVEVGKSLRVAPDDRIWLRVAKANKLAEAHASAI
jgi:hypothetical protein